MPAPINVPAHQKLAIQELASLSSDAYNELQKDLADGRVYSETSAVIEEISKALEPHTKLGGQILGTIIGLRTFLDRSDLAPADVAEGVAVDSLNKGFINAAQNGVLVERLTKLLDTRAVTVSAKAYSLVSEDAAPFNDVRIVSDVRAIFSGKESQLAVSGSIIVHHLRIENGGEGEDLYAALTTTDLLKLKRTVERALEKDKKLREALRDGPLAPLETPLAAEKQ